MSLTPGDRSGRDVLPVDARLIAELQQQLRQVAADDPLTVALCDQLRTLAVQDPIGALRRIAALKAVLAEREREAVVAAIAEHSWRSVGEALGVSKQAAFQRFGRDWAAARRPGLDDHEWRREVRRSLREDRTRSRRGRDR